MRRLNDWLARNATWPRVVAAFVAMNASIYGMNLMVPHFESVTGGRTFIDMQIPVTSDMIFEQLPFYTAQSKSLYAQFIALDFLFPLLGGLFVALLWARLLKLAATDRAAQLMGGIFVLVPFAATALDWLENIGFLMTVLLYPTRIEWVTETAVLLRQAKLFMMSVNVAGTIIVLLVLATALFARWRSRSSS